MAIGAVLEPPVVETNPIERADRRLAELDRQAREWSGISAAATAALVAIVEEADREGYVDCFDFRSLEQWVTLRCGITWAHAARLILIARGLRDLPSVRERFASGAISEDHAFEIARAGVRPFNDGDAADFASSMTVPQLRKALSFLPPPEISDPAPAPDAEPAATADVDRGAADPAGADGTSGTSGTDAGTASTGRDRGSDEAQGPAEWLRYGPEGPGVWGLHLRLSAERGALVELAIGAGRDREYRNRHGTDPDLNDPPTTISNLDGLLRMLDDALDVADPATRDGRHPSDRYLVNIHLHPTGATHLHLGQALDAATRDELCCDTDSRTWTHHPNGNVDLGRRARVVTPRLRAVVEHRDGGCAVPGCDQTRRLRVHHITHWQDGGCTDTANLVCLCPAHHRLVHRGQLRIAGNPDDDTLTITNRHGQPFTTAPPIPATPERLAASAAQATGSPFRAGESVQWHWVTWNIPPPPEPKPRPPAPRAAPPNRSATLDADPANDDQPHPADTDPPQPAKARDYPDWYGGDAWDHSGPLTYRDGNDIVTYG